MAPVLKSKWRKLRDERGQTSVEWILLMGMTFIVAYIITTGPAAYYTRQAIFTIRGAMANVVQNADLKPGNLVGTTDNGHPSDPKRLQPLH